MEEEKKLAEETPKVEQEEPEEEDREEKIQRITDLALGFNKNASILTQKREAD